MTQPGGNQRSANAITARIKQSNFPVLKYLETFDFTLTPQVSKQKVLERMLTMKEKLDLLIVDELG